MNATAHSPTVLLHSHTRHAMPPATASGTAAPADPSSPTSAAPPVSSASGSSPPQQSGPPPPLGRDPLFVDVDSNDDSFFPKKVHKMQIFARGPSATLLILSSVFSTPFMRSRKTTFSGTAGEEPTPDANAAERSEGPRASAAPDGPD